MNIDDKFWNDTVGKLRRATNLAPWSLAEAEKKLAEAGECPLTPCEVDAMVRSALWQGPCSSPSSAHVLEPMQAPERAMIEDEVYQLNRNKGQATTGPDELMDHLRKKALSEETMDIETLLTQIPLGSLRSYTWVAERLGLGREAARAAGQAIARVTLAHWEHGDIFPDTFPWWRVVGIDGEIRTIHENETSYFRQIERLESEGHCLEPDGSGALRIANVQKTPDFA